MDQAQQTVSNEVLDKKIQAIQGSTRTSMPFMVPTHDWLRQRSTAYYNWHLNPNSNTVHWIAFIVTILGVIAGIVISYYIY